jgi:Ca2+-binding RTX toxin-like protein
MVGGAGNGTLTAGAGKRPSDRRAISDILNSGTGSDTFDFDLVSDSPPARRPVVVD